MVELPDLFPGLAVVDTTCLSAKGTRFQNHSELKVMYLSAELQTLSSHKQASNIIKSQTNIIKITNKLYRRRMFMIYLIHEGQYTQITKQNSKLLSKL